jgi:hypothetical protein
MPTGKEGYGKCQKNQVEFFGTTGNFWANFPIVIPDSFTNEKIGTCPQRSSDHRPHKIYSH